MIDKNGKELTIGSIIDIHQTVNGENLFVIWNLEKLDIRYKSNLEYKYEYDPIDLLKPDRFTGEVEFEIIGNLLY